MRAAILTVSTSLASGGGKNLSGPALADAAAATGAEVVASSVVADDFGAIERWLNEQIAEGTELVLTTGGTGPRPDDLTPQVTRAVIDRELPGMAEAMRAESLRYTPMAMLSRATAGVADRSLIINFPGSPKAIELLFGVVAPVLEHAVATLHREDAAHRTHAKH